VPAPLSGMPLEDALELIAEHSPSPGGGSAAAIAGAAAAALVEMAASFAASRNSGESARATAALERASALRTGLMRLADADRASYEPVLAALARPRGEEGRTRALRKALSGASDVPLQIATATAEVTELAGELAGVEGNEQLAGDVAVAVLLGEAATAAAARLIFLNLGARSSEPRVLDARELAHRARHARLAIE
jgi:formiminotetrahydrofolate cyclodeaminase